MRREYNGKWAAAAAVICLAAGLTACGGGQTAESREQTAAEQEAGSAQETAQAVETEAQTGEEEIPEGEPLAVEESEMEAQLRLISENSQLWTEGEALYGGYYVYAVTDLNQNGRLEVISSVCEGSGLYTTSTFWEVNEAEDGLVRYEKTTPEGDSEADIEVSTAKAYYDASSDSYYYIFDDVIRNGASEHYYNKRALRLADGAVEETPLANMSVIYTEGSEDPEITCTDAQGNFFTEEEYDQVEDRVFADQTPFTLSLNWVSASNLISSDNSSVTMHGLNENSRLQLLQASWEGFTLKEETE